MTITAKVRKRMIENGRLVHAIVQGESNATTILFRIEGETDLVAEETLFLYLLYKRPNDQTVQLPILLDYTIEDGVILATFTPGAYFTADAGPVEISVIATSSAAELGGSGEVTNTLLWSSFPAWLLVAPSQLADSNTIIEENVFTQYLAELEALDADAKDYASDAEEYAKGTRSDGGTVTHATDNAKYYKNLAKDWASKIGGAVEGGEMSAKYYAGTADSRAKEAEGYALGTVSGSPSATFAGKNAKELASDAQDWAKGTRSDGKTPSHTLDSAKAYAESAAASAGIVSDHATAIDAIYADLLNIDVVATDIQDDDSVIDAVAQNIANVNAVAGNESNINAVNSNKTNIDTVAGSISNVGTVAGNISNVNAVAGNTANINAVKTNESNINTVAGISSNVTTVAGIASDVTAVAGIASDVSAVEDIKTDVSAVAAIDSDVSAVSAIKDDVSAVATIDDDVTTVATDISDVSAVASDITKVAAVADDLTNIDSVADDLTNIDNAVNYALEAEGFAVGEQNGTPVSSGSPYYQNNAKYYSQEVPALKSAIQANSNRISNLEENLDPTGAYKTVNYRGDNAVPTGKAKYGLVESIVGKSRAWNNRALPLTSANYPNGVATITDGVATGTRTSAGWVVGRNAQAWLRHTYLVAVQVKLTSETTSVYLRCAGSNRVATQSTTSWQTLVAVFEADPSGTGMAINDERTSGWDAVSAKKFIVRDLNLIFPEKDPSTELTLANLPNLVKLCPDLLKYDPYGYSLVDTVVEGVKAIGFNRFDGVMELGQINDTTGELEPSSTKLRSKNYIKVKPSTTYYYYNGSNENTGMFFYDINHNYLGRVVGGLTYNSTFITPPSCQYVLFGLSSSYGTTYKYDICINVSGSSDGTYKSYMTDTLTLPSSVTLRSAGSVAEVYDLETGKVTHPVGDKDFNDVTWTNPFGTYWVGTSFSNLPNVGNGEIPKWTHTNYVVMAGLDVANGGIGIGQTAGGDIIARTGDNVNHPTGTLYFALATPLDPTQLTPVINNTIQTEGGGTINTIQTQTTKIDNCLDVGYLAL